MEYNNKYAIEWQYGMKQTLGFVSLHPDYKEVYITDKRAQPYIFVLYNLQYPLNDFLKDVKFNTGEEKSYSKVASFNKFIFKWDILGSQPDWGKLYILTPSEYDGLKYKLNFEIKKLIQFPNGGDAFYIVSKGI